MAGMHYFYWMPAFAGMTVLQGVFVWRAKAW
jgi:hypothetical protein